MTASGIADVQSRISASQAQLGALAVPSRALGARRSPLAPAPARSRVRSTTH